MRSTALILSLSLFALSATAAGAATYSSVYDAAGVAAYVDELAKSGYSVVSILPATTVSQEVCSPCMTFNGHEVCAEPGGPPFCRQETQIQSVLVIYQEKPADACAQQP